MAVGICTFVFVGLFVVFFVLSLGLGCKLSDAKEQLKIAREINTEHEKEIIRVNQMYDNGQKAMYDNGQKAEREQRRIKRKQKIVMVSMIADMMQNFEIDADDISLEIGVRQEDELQNKDENDES